MTVLSISDVSENMEVKQKYDLLDIKDEHITTKSFAVLVN